MNNNQINPHSHEDSTYRPHKFQKLVTTIAGSSGGPINIPEFVGHIPIIHPHNSKNQIPDINMNEPLHQQQNQIQDQNPRNHSSPHNYNNQSPRNHFSTNNYNNQQSNHPPNADEGPFCRYQEDHIQEGISSCKQSLIGKLLTEKIIPKQIVQNTLLGIWGDPKGFQISEIEGGFLHITMENEKAIQRALQGNPWIVRNSWLMVQQWDREKDPKEIEFHKVPIWIQLWGLPLHCKTITMGKHLGSQLGLVEDVALYDFPDKARIVKIKVHIDTNQPIRPGLFIGNTKDGIKWVDFRYENLPMFCFLCGYIGHNETSCNYASPTTEEGSTNPRGPWLRSTSYGKRINDKRDPRFNSNPMKSISGGNFSPIPKAILDLLAKMTLEEEESASDKTPNTEQRAEGMSTNTSLNNTTGAPRINKQQTTELAGLLSKASQEQ
jgi:hypothetical protein